MKRFNFRIIATGFALACAGFVFGAILGRILKYQKTGYELDAWLIVLFPALMLASILFHELGHAFGGSLAGFELRLLAAGPLRLDRGPKGLRLSYNRSLSLWGGVASSSPRPGRIPDPAAMRRKLLLIVAGGPTASIIGGMLGLPAWLYWDSSPNLAVTCALLAFANLSLAVSTLVPLTCAGFHSDGQRLLDLLGNTEDARRWIATTSLGAMALERRPREWPQSAIEAVTEGQVVKHGANYDAIRGMWLRHHWHLDRKEYTAAQLWLERALSYECSWPAASRPLLHSSAAAFFARQGSDLPRARMHLNRAQQPGFLGPERLSLTEAIVLQAEGKPEEARHSAQKAQAILGQRQGSSREALVEELAGLGV